MPGRANPVRFPGPLIEGMLLRRFQRFLVDVRLPDGRVVTAHTPNPGSMLTCLEPRTNCWLTHSAGPRRRLEYTWQVAELGRQRIYVNPIGVNSVVGEALEQGRVPALRGYSEVQREVRVGTSRLDFRLTRGQQHCYVEVKSATLTLGGGRTAFPDAVTTRGLRHLQLLDALRRQGHRAVLLFCASRNDTRSLEPADAIDPTYAQALRRVARSGVEVLAHRCRITRRGVWLGARATGTMTTLAAPPHHAPGRAQGDTRLPAKTRDDWQDDNVGASSSG